MTAVRHELRFLLRHTAVYGLGMMLSRFVAFLLLPLYTRYLTPTDYGILELIGATSSLVGLILGFGVAHALTRFYYELPEPERPRLVATAYALAAGAATIGALSCMPASPWLAAVVLDGPQYARHFQIGFASLLVGLFSDIGMAYLRLLYRSTAAIAVALASLVLTVSLNVFLIVWLQLGVLGVLTGNLIAQTAVALPLTAAVLSGTGFRPKASIARAVVAYTAPLVPSGLMTMGAAQADRYFLRYFVSIADTGLFGLASKLSGSIHLFVTSTFMLTFMPRRFEIADQPDARRVLARIFDFHFAAFLLPAMLMAMFVREVLLLMTTPAFYPSGNLVPILLLQALAVSSKYHFEFGIMHTKQTKYYVYANAVSGAVHVVLGFILVRTYSIWGAAFAGLASSALYGLLLHLAARRLYYIPFAFGRNALALSIAAAAVGLAWLVPADNLVLDVTLKALLAAGAGLLFLWVYRIQPASLLRMAVPGPSPAAP
ncbi:MAG TPA: oligosaccharide flippase family protein [Vicinamibacterales bacterium]|nr:oligosaccharide flippase family protein [Vicinamibacterales bacterium]